jgi:hypothetical protein
MRMWSATWTAIQVAGVVCAFLVFGGRGVKYFVLAAMYAHDDLGRRLSLGLGFGGLMAWMVAVAFPLELVDSGRHSYWLFGVIVAGIVVGELNTSFWRWRLARARERRVDGAGGPRTLRS